MRRTAFISAVAILTTALPLVEASAGGCHRHLRRGPPCALYAPGSPYEAWRAYYTAQAEISFARRAASANYYAATGRAPPARYFGPPTNSYAERYALEPNSYFTCPLARRGDGICSTAWDSIFPQ
jgi:hypothetical protein